MDFSSNFYTNLIAVISLLISGTIFILYFIDRRKATFQILSDYTKQLLDWHGDTVEILINLKLLSINNKDCDKTNLLSKLSTQIEKGRFFFPNIDLHNSFGKDKPVAFQGYRNLTLDFLVYSYNLFSRADSAKYVKHAEKLQREFTSIVFEVVRPKENLDQIKKLTDRYFSHENIFEDYLDKNPEATKFMY